MYSTLLCVEMKCGWRESCSDTVTLRECGLLIYRAAHIINHNHAVEKMDIHSTLATGEGVGFFTSLDNFPLDTVDK